VRQEDTDRYLPNVCALATHVGAGDYLEVGLAFNHSAVVVDAGGGVLEVDERMLALN
jgi:hypothetical protein